MRAVPEVGEAQERERRPFAHGAPVRRPTIHMGDVTNRSGSRNLNARYFAKLLGRAIVILGRGQVHLRDSGSDSGGRLKAIEPKEPVLDGDYRLNTVLRRQTEVDDDGQSRFVYVVEVELMTVKTQERAWVRETRIATELSLSPPASDDW